MYWGAETETQAARVVHFQTNHKEGYRLLTHFYTFIHTTTPAHERRMKRFIRDRFRYIDPILCAAYRAVSALRARGGGAYSAIHARRGDFQYKQVKVSAEVMASTLGPDVFKRGEVVFIATDEKNRSFFTPLATGLGVELAFIEDVAGVARLSELNPNFAGIVELVIAAESRSFAGTWFSTFSGYINRLRGYRGLDGRSSFYHYQKKRDEMHTWAPLKTPFYSVERPFGWFDLDDDSGDGAVGPVGPFPPDRRLLRAPDR